MSAENNGKDIKKNLNTAPKVLANRSNAMWDILLPTEPETKQLAGNALATAAVRLQTE